VNRILSISILALAVASGCGHAAGGGESAPPSKPTSIQRWERQLDHLHDLVGGSPRERAAGDLVLFHRQQDPLTACMRAGGIDYTPPAWADMWRVRDSRGIGASASAFLEPIDDPDFLVRVERGEAEAQRETGGDEGRSNRAYASLGPAAKARWDAVLKRCPRGGGGTEGWHPAVGYQSLMNAYYGLLGIGDTAAAAHARGYKGCMQAAGIQADNASVLPDALIPDFPPDQAPAGGRGGPLFQKWVAKVHRAMAVDAHCRRAAFLAGWRALGPRIAPWEHADAAAIAALHRRWEALVSTAEHEPGWDWPTSG
jgi:hypothetical protein